MEILIIQKEAVEEMAAHEITCRPCRGKHQPVLPLL